MPPLPVYFASRRKGAAVCRDAVAQAINPQQKVVIHNFREYLQKIREFRTHSRQLTGQKELHSSPVFIHYTRNMLSNLAVGVFKAAVPQAYLVSVARPTPLAPKFDLVAALPFQSQKRGRHGKVIKIDSIPNLISANALQNAAATWAPTLLRSNRPVVAILVGGDIRPYLPSPIRAKEAHDLADKIEQAVSKQQIDFVITNSRRTPPDVTEILKARISPLCSHSYLVEKNGPPQGHNPLMGYMACASAILVTPDSLTMVSEGIETGKPVYAFQGIAGRLPSQHRRFTENLVQLGRAQWYNDQPFVFDAAPVYRPTHKISEVVARELEHIEALRRPVPAPIIDNLIKTLPFGR